MIMMWILVSFSMWCGGSLWAVDEMRASFSSQGISSPETSPVMAPKSVDDCLDWCFYVTQTIRCKKKKQRSAYLFRYDFSVGKWVIHHAKYIAVNQHHVPYDTCLQDIVCGVYSMSLLRTDDGRMCVPVVGGEFLVLETQHRRAYDTKGACVGVMDIVRVPRAAVQLREWVLRRLRCLQWVEISEPVRLDARNRLLRNVQHVTCLVKDCVSRNTSFFDQIMGKLFTPVRVQKSPHFKPFILELSKESYMAPWEALWS